MGKTSRISSFRRHKRVCTVLSKFFFPLLWHSCLPPVRETIVNQFLFLFLFWLSETWQSCTRKYVYVFFALYSSINKSMQDTLLWCQHLSAPSIQFPDNCSYSSLIPHQNWTRSNFLNPMLKSLSFSLSCPLPLLLSSSLLLVLLLYNWRVFHFLDFSIMKWLRPLLIDILNCLKLCSAYTALQGTTLYPHQFAYVWLYS